MLMLKLYVLLTVFRMLMLKMYILLTVFPLPSLCFYATQLPLSLYTELNHSTATADWLLSCISCI